MSAQSAASEKARVAHPAGPTLGQVMRKPQWILALIGVLLIAGIFAWLAQWQMSHAIRLDDENIVNTEAAVPLAELTAPGAAVTDIAAGHLATVSGELVAGDFTVIANRLNGEQAGFWVAGHALVAADQRQSADSAANLAVAIAWAPDLKTAQTAASRLNNLATLPAGIEFSGRYNPTEAPGIPEFIDGVAVFETMAPPQQLNVWKNRVAVQSYTGFLVLDSDNQIFAAVPELTEIDSVPPSPPEKVNWLNLFYAIEWVIFAGFAVYFWVRLCRDARDREHEMLYMIHNEEQRN